MLRVYFGALCQIIQQNNAGRCYWNATKQARCVPLHCPSLPCFPILCPPPFSAALARSPAYRTYAASFHIRRCASTAAAPLRRLWAALDSSCTRQWQCNTAAAQRPALHAARWLMSRARGQGAHPPRCCCAWQAFMGAGCVPSTATLCACTHLTARAPAPHEAALPCPLPPCNGRTAPIAGRADRAARSPMRMVSDFMPSILPGSTIRPGSQPGFVLLHRLLHWQMPPIRSSQSHHRTEPPLSCGMPSACAARCCSPPPQDFSSSSAPKISVCSAKDLLSLSPADIVNKLRLFLYLICGLFGGAARSAPSPSEPHA